MPINLQAAVDAAAAQDVADALAAQATVIEDLQAEAEVAQSEIEHLKAELQECRDLNQVPADCSAEKAIIEQRDATIAQQVADLAQKDTQIAALQTEKTNLQTSLNTCLADLAECEGATEPPTPTPTPPPSTGTIPLSYNDARFSGNTVSSSITQASGTILKKSITDTGHTASIVATGLVTVDTCRINSRECIRVTKGVKVLNSYLEATGTGADHADTIQTYSPGERSGILECTDTAIVAHNTAATAGLFVADNWGGNVTLKNVMFWGGPYGCRIHADSGATVNVSMEDIYFVGPFMWGPLLITPAGGTLNITKWVNVFNATIVNGALVKGTPIARP